MPRRGRSKTTGKGWKALVLLLASLLLFAFGAPARAGEVYSWRTADGGTAFTDDPKSIPARYRGQAEVRHTAQLGTYERFSGQDAVSAKRYEQGGRTLLEPQRLDGGTRRRAVEAEKRIDEAPAGTWHP